MAEPLVVGIDLGTSALKCAIYDANGRRHAAARVPHRTHVDDELVEQCAGDWWLGLCGALASVTAKLEGTVVAIGIAGHGPSPVVVDAELREVAPVMMWRDRRARAAELAMQLGAVSGPERLGLQFAARTAWLRDHAPARFRRATTVLHSGDYLAARLTGQRLATGWDGERAFAAAGLPRALLPEAHGALLGVAADVAVRPGTPVVSVGLDSYAGTLGSGVGSPGDACINGGSSAVVAIVAGAEGSRFRLGPHGIHSRPIVAGVALERVLEPVDAAHRDALVREAVGRAPARDAHLGSVMLGEPAFDQLIARVVASSGRVAAIRTVLDAIVLAERRVLAQLEHAHGTARRIRLVGGQAQTAQLVADGLGRSIEVPSVVEAGTLGAAMVAATQLGWNVATMVQVARTFEPVGRAAAAYDSLIASCESGEHDR